jgi:hypothetical protein
MVTHVEVTKLLLSNTSNLDALLSQAINPVCRPLLANLIRDPANPRFGSVRCANAKIAAALGFPGVLAWFKLCGFVQETSEIESSNSGGGGATATATVSEVMLVWKGTKEALQAGNKALSVAEDAIEEGKQAKLRSGQQTHSLRSRKAEQEKDDAKARILEQLERDRAAVGRREEQRLEEEKQQLLQEADFEEVKHLEEAAKKTLHYHGRIRNASYNAEHFKLRRMTHGRAHVCSVGCPNDYIEAHWHVRNAALLYSYVVHLNADATEVIHQGPEDGYQYNSLPGTPHFGKTLFISTKVVDSAGKVKCETPNTSVEFCRHCMVSFRKLAV